MESGCGRCGHRIIDGPEVYGAGIELLETWRTSTSRIVERGDEHPLQFRAPAAHSLDGPTGNKPICLGNENGKSILLPSTIA